VCSILTLVVKSVVARTLRVIKYLLAEVSGQLPLLAQCSVLIRWPISAAWRRTLH
jgi:hypothetical protein